MISNRRSESMSSADVSYLYVNDSSILSQSLIRSVETKPSSTRSDAADYVSCPLDASRRLAPTWSAGHRSKHVTLLNEVALRRERRRARYRMTTRQWLEQRQCIENGLHQQLNGLGIRQIQLKDYWWDLHSRRHNVERRIDQHLSTDLLSDIVLTDAVVGPSLANQHANEMHRFSTSTDGHSINSSVVWSMHLFFVCCDLSIGDCVRCFLRKYHRSINTGPFVSPYGSKQNLIDALSK